MDVKTNNHQLFRSPLMMTPSDTALLVVDVQEKLVPAINEHESMIWNISRLIRGATELGIEICVTEQYPKGLGKTADSITQWLPPTIRESIPEKLMFSCRECTTEFEQLVEKGLTKILICGIEAHVCVLQTALDLLASGFAVYLCVDAVGSRNVSHKDIAIRRLEASGATLVTTEMALFEWCEKAGTSQFKAISKLVRETH